MKYFFSDTHFGDDRLGINGKPNVFFRPFNSVREQNDTMLSNIIGILGKDCTELYCIGDIIIDLNTESYLKYIKDKFPQVEMILIKGNYDVGKLEMLSKYFDTIVDSMIITIGNKKLFLNHYPVKCKEFLENDATIDFAITGHIHSLWKVQPKMVNVSVDAWHFKPVSEEEILFIINGCDKHYDANVFPYIKK